MEEDKLVNTRVGLWLAQLFVDGDMRHSYPP